MNGGSTYARLPAVVARQGVRVSSKVLRLERVFSTQTPRVWKISPPVEPSLTNQLELFFELSSITSITLGRRWGRRRRCVAAFLSLVSCLAASPHSRYSLIFSQKRHLTGRSLVFRVVGESEVDCYCARHRRVCVVQSSNLTTTTPWSPETFTRAHPETGRREWSQLLLRSTRRYTRARDERRTRGLCTFVCLMRGLRVRGFARA